MTRLVVDLDRLDDLVERMAVMQAHLARARHEVDTSARQLHVSWTGEAAARQAAAHERWAVGAAEVHEALAALRSIAAVARANYHAAMLANRRMWSV